MKRCSCSIHEVREEQILEASGSLSVRLICNLCGSILDAKIVGLPPGGRDDGRRRGDEGAQVRLPNC